MTPERWRAIEKLFNEVAGLPLQERAAQLASVDPELRQEVEKLLASDGLSTPAVVKAVQEVAADLVAPAMPAKVGHYRVLSKIGEGGMGIVYAAEDTRLGRKVAIKTLPAEFSRDPHRVARFQREAEVLASLNHPNIAQVYGLEDSRSQRCIVMELVEGDTLQQRLQRGAIPVAEALQIAKQIAEALEAAHERGVIHRDLKPGNIKLTSDGTVKVLDFGLAKALQEGRAPDVSNSTVVSADSLPGVILGTAAYMSPEQAKGKPVDKRTDIYVFGLVLYEMVTGQRLHRGDTTTEVLASVITEEPDWDKVPARVQRLLRRCLEKDPQKRLRHIGDVMDLVDDVPAAPALTRGTVQPRRRSWGVLVSACVLVAATAALAAWLLKPAPPRSVTRFAMSLPAGQRVLTNRPEIAISPDGTRLVYSAGQGVGSIQLYLRAMDGLEARAIPGTEGATGPFFSPDGQWIGFSAAGKLKKVSLSGGGPITLADVGPANGAFWGYLGQPRRHRLRCRKQ